MCQFFDTLLRLFCLWVNLNKFYKHCQALILFISFWYLMIFLFYFLTSVRFRDPTLPHPPLWHLVACRHLLLIICTNNFKFFKKPPHLFFWYHAHPIYVIVVIWKRTPHYFLCLLLFTQPSISPILMHGSSMI